ncbi:MAG: DUF6702 family protein [Candidatus Paceibacterota bacterium]
MNSFLLLPLLVMHPFHVTLTEAEWNRQTNRLECSLRVDPRDLDMALSAHEKKPIRSEELSADELERITTEYLRKRIRLLRTGQDEPATLHWVGSEADSKYRWFYFELQPPAGEQTLMMENRLFFEVQAGQRNTVVFRRKQKKSRAAVFTESAARQEVKFDQE